MGKMVYLEDVLQEVDMFLKTCTGSEHAAGIEWLRDNLSTMDALKMKTLQWQRHGGARFKCTPVAEKEFMIANYGTEDRWRIYGFVLPGVRYADFKTRGHETAREAMTETQRIWDAFILTCVEDR